MRNPAQIMSSREFNQGTGAANRAAQKGPVYITDRNRPSHVLLSYDQYMKIVQDKPTLIDTLCRTPGIGDIELEIPRSRDVAHPASFD